MRLSIAIVLIFASIQSLDCHKSLSEIIAHYNRHSTVRLIRFVTEGKSGNVTVSPASIKSQCTMDLMDLEINSSSVTIYGLFVSKPLQLRKECVDFTRVNKLDFNDPRTAADEINGWVNSKTGGLIPAILDQAHINPKTELLLTSALYFKGTWLNEFDLKQTHGECFYRNGVCKTVAMMNLEAELNYAHVDDLRAHALELPYQNKRYSMMILMPQDRDAGLALIRHLPDFRLQDISNMLQPTHVVLTMPKFTGPSYSTFGTREVSVSYLRERLKTRQTSMLLLTISLVSLKTSRVSQQTNQFRQQTNQVSQPSQPTRDPSQSTSVPTTEYSTRPYYDEPSIDWFQKVSSYFG